MGNKENKENKLIGFLTIRLYTHGQYSLSSAYDNNIVDTDTYCLNYVIDNGTKEDNRIVVAKILDTIKQSIKTKNKQTIIPVKAHLVSAGRNILDNVNITNFFYPMREPFDTSFISYIESENFALNHYSDKMFEETIKETEIEKEETDYTCFPTYESLFFNGVMGVKALSTGIFNVNTKTGIEEMVDNLHPFVIVNDLAIYANGTSELAINLYNSMKEEALKDEDNETPVNLTNKVIHLVNFTGRDKNEINQDTFGFNTLNSFIKSYYLYPGNKSDYLIYTHPKAPQFYTLNQIKQELGKEIILIQDNNS